MKSASFLSAAAAVVGLVVIPACQTGPVTDSTMDEGPVFGKPDRTEIVVASDTGEVNLSDLARIVKTVRKYKRLNASEQEIIRRVAALKLDGVVAMEMQRLAPKFEPRKQAIRRQTTEQIAEIRRRGARQKISPARIAEQEAEVKASEGPRIAAIDAEWRQAAMQTVTQKYGSDFAVPVKTADNRSVVAFASLGESGVQVASDAYELNFSAAQFAVAKRANVRVPHAGGSFAVLDTEAVIDQ